MEKMIKLSKLAYMMTKILKIFFFVCSLLIIFGLIALLVIDNNHILENVKTTQGQLTKRNALAVMIPAIVALSFITLVMNELEKIFSTMKEKNSPFTKENVISIRKISLFVLLGFVLSISLTAILSIIMKIKVDIEINLINLVVIFIIYVISFIFEYGVKLQEQVDETL